MDLLYSLADLTPLGAIALSVSLFSGSLVPFFLLVDADFDAFGQRCAAAAGAVVRPTREACRDLAALLILLTTSPKGAMA